MDYDPGMIIDMINDVMMNHSTRDYIVLPNARHVKITKTLQTFAVHGISCAKCGIEGTVFKETRLIDHKDNNRSFLRLHTTNKRNFMNCDHVIPTSKGGADQIWNYQTYCHSCNVRKSDDMTRSFRLVYQQRNIKKFFRNKYEEFNRELKEFITDVVKYRYEIKSGFPQIFTEDEMRKIIDDIYVLFGIQIEYSEIVTYAEKVPA